MYHGQCNMLHYISGTNDKIKYDLSSIIREYDHAKPAQIISL